MPSGIYKIQSKSHPERIYIGSAVNIDRRWQHHLFALKGGYHKNIKLQRHYNVYGEEDLRFFILAGCEKEELIKNEQYFLDSLKTYFNINIIATSSLGVKRSEEFKQKLRKPHTAEHIKKVADKKRGHATWNKGIKNCFSPETIKKMQYERTPEWRQGARERQSGVRMTPESSKKKSIAMEEIWRLRKLGILNKPNYKSKKNEQIKS